MKCQNCGFDSDEKICSVCGAEIVEVKEENLKTVQNISDNVDNKKSDDSKPEKQKVKFGKLLMLILIIILSTAVVSASSIAVFYFATYDNRTSFAKINQTVNCGDFSVKLKEVKTPEISLEYYPQIVYDLVFEFHNNTGNTLTIKSPEINGIIKGEGEDIGYVICDNDIYKLNGKRNLSVSFEISAWSDVEIIIRVYYEDYTDGNILYEYGGDPLASSVISGADETDDGNNSLEDNEDDENEESIAGSYDEVIEIDRRKIKYKKESLQRYKENSPENFYLILSSGKFNLDDEEQYARFFVEPDKEAITIPEGENIE